MNILGIENHIKFEKIFADARVDGQISWIKLSQMKDLPPSFIEEYFSKLKIFGIEKNQNLDDDIINAHKDELNWYSLLKYQNLSEKCIIENLDKINKSNMWCCLVKYQKLSLNFLIDHIDKFKTNKKLIFYLEQNGQIPSDTKTKVKNCLYAQLA